MNKKSIFKDGANKYLTHPKGTKGITLIALVITIIVMLILVAVTITMAVNGGLFEYAGRAGKETQNAIDKEQELANGKVEIGGEWYNSIDEYLSKDKVEPIPTTESYVGYYADINDDGTVDGVIYADLAFDANGTWSSTNSSTFSYTASSNLKNYAISTWTYGEQTTAGTYTANGFGEKSVLVPIGETGNDRFYVMALEDFTDGTNTIFCWYDAAFENMSDYKTATSTAFETGETNTTAMIAKWNAGGYGTQNDGSKPDVWGVIQAKVNAGWFVPSKDEWSAFGSNLGIRLNYSQYGLSYYYWSSSQSGTNYAWGAGFGNGHMSFNNVNHSRYVRLSATF